MTEEQMLEEEGPEEKAICIACHGPFEIATSEDGGDILCVDCETEYAEYLATYHPRHAISTDGHRGMTSPQTRFQWAAHRSK